MKTSLITEKESLYKNLPSQSILELITNMHKENLKIFTAIEKQIPAICLLVEQVVKTLKKGGRIFYLGSGTSGRLGVLDASELLPTFGLKNGVFIPIIAGGKKAILSAVENAEDNEIAGWRELKKYTICFKDLVIGISASGRTAFVLKALEKCYNNNIKTALITSNPISQKINFISLQVEVITGPEFLTGSTRLKAGTCHKIILNMISTISLIKLGKVLDNEMAYLQLSNNKLRLRAIKMVQKRLNITEAEALGLINKYKSPAKIIKKYENKR